VLGFFLKGIGVSSTSFDARSIRRTLAVVALLKMHVFDNDGQRHDIELVKRGEVSVVECNLEVVLVSHHVDAVTDALSGDRRNHSVAGVARSIHLQVNILATAHPAELAARHEGHHLRVSILVLKRPGTQSTPRARGLVDSSQDLSAIGLDEQLLSSTAALCGAWIAQPAAWAAATCVRAVERSLVRQVRLAIQIEEFHLERGELFAALADTAVGILDQSENGRRVSVCLNRESVGDFASSGHLEAFSSGSFLLDVN